MLLVGLGMGASLTLSSVASSVPAEDVKFLEIDDPINVPMPLRLVWRRDALNPVLQTVIDTATSSPNLRLPDSAYHLPIAGEAFSAIDARMTLNLAFCAMMALVAINI